MDLIMKKDILTEEEPERDDLDNSSYINKRIDNYTEGASDNNSENKNDTEKEETIIAFTNYSTWGQRNNGNLATTGNLLDYVNWR